MEILAARMAWKKRSIEEGGIGQIRYLAPLPQRSAWSRPYGCAKHVARFAEGIGRLQGWH